MTKIIILDEADSLTEGAQQALRMIMSDYSDTTRFVLSCNISSKLIEPIQSRCVVLRFNKLKDQDVKNNLERIIQA
jgi:replication factor C subunit 2/4